MLSADAALLKALKEVLKELKVEWRGPYECVCAHCVERNARVKNAIAMARKAIRDAERTAQ